MPHTIREITNQHEWDTFVQKQMFSPFVQSPAYGKFYESMGERYWIFGVYDSTNTLVGGSLVVSTHAKRGNFLYLPYGPILDYSNAGILKQFLHHLHTFAKEHKYDFIRVSPLTDDTSEAQKAMRTHSYRPAPMHVLAEYSWILDVTPDEETLLKNMKKNHRNLIRRCMREGVKVEMRKDQEGLNFLNTALDQTEKRHDFIRFPRKYVQKEFDIFGERGEVVVFVSYLPDGEFDAASVMMFYGNMAVYRHSGSLGKNRKLPSSYLIQWEAIKEAKRRGMHWYNFWGIMPPNAGDNHPYKGITHFKKGFGGFEKNLLHCHDRPVSAKYWLNWGVETLRRMRRGF